MDLVCPSFVAHSAPALCRQIDVYCERTSFALDGEPLNALTNVAMLAVAVMAAVLQIRRPNRDARGLIWGAIVAVAIGGLGATLFHTTAAAWTVWIDMAPFLVFMLIILWLTLTRHFAWTAWPSGLGLIGFLAVTMGAGPLLPRALLPPGAYYLTPLIILVVVALLLRRRGVAAATSFVIAAAVFLGAFLARELDAPLCATFPAGTHFIWHLLAAVLAWVLIRSAILETPPRTDAFGRKLRSTGDMPG